MMRKVKINTKLNKSQSQDVMVTCYKCSTKTYHTVMLSVDIDGQEDYDPETFFAWFDNWQIIQCNGCHSFSFRHVHENTKDGFSDEYGKWVPNVMEKVYPSRVESRRALEDTYYLPYKVRLIYEETITSLSNRLYVLTGVGLRAAIETVCNDKEATGRNLNEKIDDLVRRGMLNQDGAEILHKLRILGNKAAHEVEPHNEEQLALAVNVLENLLESAYIFPSKAPVTFTS